MRKPKKMKTELIHLIEETWAKTQRGKNISSHEQAEIIAAIDGTLYFLKLFDELRNENHNTYFIKKYLSLSNNMSQLQLSNRYNICRDSVSTYCDMYIKIFEENLRIVKGLKELSEYEKLSVQSALSTIAHTTVQNRKKCPI